MRTLSLAKEVLTELTTGELTAVVGGTVKTRVCPTDPCITPPPSDLNCSTSLGPDLCGR